MKALRLLLVMPILLLATACADQLAAPDTEDALPQSGATNAKSEGDICRECGADVPNVVGSWEGSVAFEDKMSGDRFPGRALLEVTSQDKSRFEGILRFDVSLDLPVREITFEGIVTPSQSNPGSGRLEGGPLFGVQFSTDVAPIIIFILYAQYDDTGVVPTIEGAGEYIVTQASHTEGRVYKVDGFSLKMKTASGA